MKNFETSWTKPSASRISDSDRDDEVKRLGPNSPWVEHKDDQGRTYYFNARTLVTQWDKPTELSQAEAESDNEWQKVFLVQNIII